MQLLGIRNIVLAVNKLDLVNYDEARFNAIVDDYRAFAERIGITEFTAIPIAGLQGDNTTSRSARSSDRASRGTTARPRGPDRSSRAGSPGGPIRSRT